MNKFYTFFFYLLVIFFYPLFSQAVLPPDLIFSIGNQVYQIIAGLGFLIFGLLTSIVPFLKVFFEKFKHIRRGIFIVGFLLLFLTLGSLLYSNSNIFNKNPIPDQENISEKENNRFYSDRFVISGKDDKDAPFLLDLNVSRIENKDKLYDHYYFVDIVHGSKKEQFYEKGVSANYEILENLFIKNFQRNKNLDNSARDVYNFSFSHAGKKYKIETYELVSDFIIKNKPEYTSYVSAGKVSLFIDSRKFDMNIMHQVVYSTDYTDSIYFEGLNELDSESVQLILWDSQGEFYMMDQSKVENSNPKYQSHFWGLKKDAEGRLTKIFRGELKKENISNQVKFSGNISDFSINELVLDLQENFKGNKNRGFVKGYIINGSEKKEVFGLGFYEKYGK